MNAIDANVFIRYLIGDDSAKQEKSKALIERVRTGEEAVFCTEVILHEVCYILSASTHYSLSHQEIRDRLYPILFGPQRSLTVGLGLRPNLAGCGLGASFVAAGLEFARQQFAPASFRFYVLSWNERAIRVYERAGFTQSRVVVQRNVHGENEFVEMTRPA